MTKKIFFFKLSPKIMGSLLICSFLIFYFEINRVPHVSSYLSNQKELLYDEDEGKYFFNKGNNKSLKNK